MSAVKSYRKAADHATTTVPLTFVIVQELIFEELGMIDG
jgi:hypothetical protein